MNAEEIIALSKRIAEAMEPEAQFQSADMTISNGGFWRRRMREFRLIGGEEITSPEMREPYCRLVTDPEICMKVLGALLDPDAGPHAVGLSARTGVGPNGFAAQLHGNPWQFGPSIEIAIARVWEDLQDHTVKHP